MASTPPPQVMVGGAQRGQPSVDCLLLSLQTWLPPTRTAARWKNSLASSAPIAERADHLERLGVARRANPRSWPLRTSNERFFVIKLAIHWPP